MIEKETQRRRHNTPTEMLGLALLDDQKMSSELDAQSEIQIHTIVALKSNRSTVNSQINARTAPEKGYSSVGTSQEMCRATDHPQAEAEASKIHH